MSDSVISVENLSKSYLIGHQGPRERYSSLRDSLANGTKSILRKTRDLAMGKQSLQGDSVEEFWALKDVSFEVKQGEVLGIIGRNGAGKSTLLKVLSRITEPTSGRVTLNGRVASLLEVGTGFHPELTGRENLYLNGAILGMSRKEIARKFDEIVDFAGVEKFLDTPVKRYSSGMYVRLAFAVAAHLEPEILVVDEVLAVGDAEFQKKCMGKMQDVAKGGRTVLFVSHQISALRSLCSSGILMKNGKIQMHGTIEDALNEYLGSSEHQILEAIYVPCRKKPSITKIQIDTEALNKGILKINLHYSSPFKLETIVPGIIVYATSGEPVYASNSRYHIPLQPLQSQTNGTLLFNSEKLPLIPGRYKVSAWLGDWHEDYDSKVDALEFEFLNDDRKNNQPPPSITGHISHHGEWTNFD